jgi:thermitase
VAVLDSGADLDHPDLTANLYTNDDEKPDDGRDNDGNGYVDDVHGFDAIRGRGSGVDDNGHGTHVAGIIGARGDNATGVTGVCWSARVMPVKFLDDDGRGSTSDAVAGIEYAVRQGAKIVNCSFGMRSKSEALHDAVDYAQDKNVLLVVAAGNDGRDIDERPEYPASYGDGNVLVVAATTAEDRLASWSNFGEEDVDLAAPGDAIRSTWLGDGYRTESGTSMAAPYVAGVAAMLRKQEPDASYKDLRHAIRDEADVLDALRGRVMDDGRLSARRALGAIGELVD